VRPGDNINYIVHYRNETGAQINSAILYLTLPQGATFQNFNLKSINLRIDQIQSVMSNNTLSLNLGPIPHTGEAEFDFQIQISEKVDPDTILNFPVQLNYNNNQTSVYAADNLTILKTGNLSAGLTGAVSGLFGLSIPIWLLLLLAVIIFTIINFLGREKSEVVTVKNYTVNGNGKKNGKSHFFSEPIAAKTSNSKEEEFNADNFIEGEDVGDWPVDADRDKVIPQPNLKPKK
jgi:hypothetical protein